MHVCADPKVLYFGTPVVLMSSMNEDGTSNVAPISSIWWLGRSAMIGVDTTSKTTENLLRTEECVVNLASADLVDSVDRLALTTGSRVVPRHKAAKGFRHEPGKFDVAGLTPVPSEFVRAPRIEECKVQMECRVVARHPFGAPDADAIAFEMTVLRTHLAEDLVDAVRPGHVRLDKWSPLIMMFTEFFGVVGPIHTSRLARGFGLDHARTSPASPKTRFRDSSAGDRADA